VLPTQHSGWPRAQDGEDQPDPMAPQPGPVGLGMPKASLASTSPCAVMGRSWDQEELFTGWTAQNLLDQASG
jgi:hypothetical protein